MPTSLDGSTADAGARGAAPREGTGQPGRSDHGRAGTAGVVACAAPQRPRERPRRAAHIPPAAMGLVLAAVLCFSILDGIIKWLAPRYPVAILVWARYSVQALAMLVWFGPGMGRTLLRTSHLPAQLVRGAILVASSIFFVTALRFLPLADATALNYSTPTLVVVMAVAFLNERLTRTRIAFIVAGVLGMGLIVRPGAEILHGGALLALCAAGCYATFQILTRKLADEDSRVLLFYPAVSGAVLLAFALPWLALPARLPWTDLLLIVTGGLFGTIGHFMFILAFQRAPASGVTPFTYMQLVWATLIGWLAFGDFPDRLTVLGMAVIAVSGLLLTWHERRMAWVRMHEPTTID